MNDQNMNDEMFKNDVKFYFKDEAHKQSFYRFLFKIDKWNIKQLSIYDRPIF